MEKYCWDEEPVKIFVGEHAVNFSPKYLAITT